MNLGVNDVDAPSSELELPNGHLSWNLGKFANLKLVCIPGDAKDRSTVMHCLTYSNITSNHICVVWRKEVCMLHNGYYFISMTTTRQTSSVMVMAIKFVKAEFFAV